MPLTRDNYYHPFTEEFLGAFSSNSSIKDDDWMILEDIDLYNQPIPSPVIAGVFAVVTIIILILGSHLHLEIHLRLRKDESILKGITKTFVFANSTLFPVLIILLNVTNFIHTLPPIVSIYICPVVRFTLYFTCNMVSFHSFLSATMRYYFIVHTEKVNIFGKEKVKSIFCVLSILIPFVVTIWKVIDGSEVDAMSFINKCYGRQHKVFLIETSTVNVFKKSFCEVEGYEELKGVNKIISLGKQIICAASTITMLAMGSNLTEGFIYYKLFSHMNK